MGIFATIEKDIHTFAGWAEAEWTKFYNVEPKLVTTADTILSYAGSALSIILTTVDPAAAPIVSLAFSEAQKGILVVSGLLHDLGPSPNISGTIADVNSHLSDILSTGHIVDPKSVSTLTKIVTMLENLAKAMVPSA